MFENRSLIKNRKSFWVLSFDRKRQRLSKLFRKSFTKNLYNFKVLSSLTFQTVSYRGQQRNRPPPPCAIENHLWGRCVQKSGLPCRLSATILRRTCFMVLAGCWIGGENRACMSFSHRKTTPFDASIHNMPVFRQIISGICPTRQEIRGCLKKQGR